MTQPVAREGVSPSTRADGVITETRVVARVPALDAVADAPGTSRPTIDRRILGQNLSTKILLAVGVCIVLVATVPYLLDRGNSNSDNEGSDWQMESPAPDAPEAPLFGGDESAPGFVQPGASMSPVPEMNFQPKVPQLPAWADAPRAAEGSTQTPAMGGQVRASVNPAPATTAPAWDAPQPAWDAPQSAPTWQTPTDIPRVSDRTPNWSNRPTPPSTDSEPLSSAWPNPARSHSVTVPPNFTPPPTAATSGLPAAVDAAPAYSNRYDARASGATYYRSYRESQAEANHQFVLPQHVTAVPAEYRNRHPSDGQTTYSPESRVSPPTWTGRPAEPGVARLEGIIGKQPFRTTDDRARSSVH
ncbi:MAG: hypothetical protein V3R99_11275 [Thermoguttaceae bacterium]